VVAPVRQDGGGAETRGAARNERKQKTAVLQGAARPQAVKRSRARETRRQNKGPDACRNRVSATEFRLGRERVPVNTPDCGSARETEAGEFGAAGERSRRPRVDASHRASLQEAPGERQVQMGDR